MLTPPLDHSSPALVEDGVGGMGGQRSGGPQASSPGAAGRPRPPHTRSTTPVAAANYTRGGVPRGRCAGDPSRRSCPSAARPPLVGAAGPAVRPLPVEGALFPPPANGLVGRGSGRRGPSVTRPGTLSLMLAPATGGRGRTGGTKTWATSFRVAAAPAQPGCTPERHWACGRGPDTLLPARRLPLGLRR